MGTSVWTAMAWGHGKSAAVAAAHRKLREGEEECMICRDDVPASVSFKPCGHNVCFACVENLRAKNIFKADKGVKCPFCRQFIEQYHALHNATPAMAEILAEANRAAGVAASARAPAPQPQVTPEATERENWTCPDCRNSNLWWRIECNRCKKPNPRPKPPTAARKDVSRCNRDEIIGYIKEKHHPNLNKAFLEAGLPYSNGKVTGTPDSVVAALKNRGEDKLSKVVEILTDPAVLLDCAMDFYGNYTLQDLVEATYMLRVATQGQASYLMLAYKNNHDGLDPFGALLYSLLPNCVPVSTHDKGTYVVQKLAEKCSPPELLDLCTSIFHEGPAIGADPKGVFVMIKCTQQLVEKCCQPGGPAGLRARAAELCDQLCYSFLAQMEKFKHCSHNPLGSMVLATTLQVGLPRYGALRMGSKIASHAAVLLRGRSGVAMLKGLVELRGLDQGCHDIVRDLLCIVAMKLQGSFHEWLLMDDDRTCGIVRTLVRRLAEEQEIAWIDAIIQELVGRGDELQGHEGPLEVLRTALSVPVLDHESVEEHLQQLGELIGEDINDLADDVYQRISNNPPPPPPKYFMPSVIQPDLKYMIQKGYVLPEAPPPPPYAPESGSASGSGAQAQGGSGDTWGDEQDEEQQQQEEQAGGSGTGAVGASKPAGSRVHDGLDGIIVQPSASASSARAAAAGSSGTANGGYPNMPVPMPVPMPIPMPIPTPLSMPVPMPIPMPVPIPLASSGQPPASSAAQQPTTSSQIPPSLPYATAVSSITYPAAAAPAQAGSSGSAPAVGSAGASSTTSVSAAPSASLSSASSASTATAATTSAARHSNGSGADNNDVTQRAKNALQHLFGQQQGQQQQAAQQQQQQQQQQGTGMAAAGPASAATATQSTSPTAGQQPATSVTKHGPPASALPQPSSHLAASGQHLQPGAPRPAMAVAGAAAYPMAHHPAGYPPSGMMYMGHQAASYSPYPPAMMPPGLAAAYAHHAHQHQQHQAAHGHPQMTPYGYQPPPAYYGHVSMHPPGMMPPPTSSAMTYVPMAGHHPTAMHAMQARPSGMAPPPGMTSPALATVHTAYTPAVVPTPAVVATPAVAAVAPGFPAAQQAQAAALAAPRLQPAHVPAQQPDSPSKPILRPVSSSGGGGSATSAAASSNGSTGGAAAPATTSTKPRITAAPFVPRGGQAPPAPTPAPAPPVPVSRPVVALTPPSAAAPAAPTASRPTAPAVPAVALVRAPAAAAPAAPPAVSASAPSQQSQPGSAGGSWQCKICTYMHQGAESNFLACAICGMEKGANTAK